MPVFTMRHLNFQHHNSDNNGEYPISKSFKSCFVHHCSSVGYIISLPRCIGASTLSCSSVARSTLWIFCLIINKVECYGQTTAVMMHNIVWFFMYSGIVSFSLFIYHTDISALYIDPYRKGNFFDFLLYPACTLCTPSPRSGTIPGPSLNIFRRGTTITHLPPNKQRILP